MINKDRRLAQIRRYEISADTYGNLCPSVLSNLRSSMYVHKKALTFIELLVAAAIFSVLSLAVFNALSLGFKVAGVSQTKLKSAHKVNRFLDSLDRELRNAVNLTNSSGFIGKLNELSFFFIQDVFNESIPDLRQLSRVDYFFGSQKLYKKQQYGDNLYEKIDYQELYLPITALNFTYLASKDTQEMLSEWNETQTSIPLAVNVEVTTYDERTEKEDTLNRQIFLPLRAFY